MKKRFILIGAISAVFALGLSLTAIHSNETVSVVSAEQHIDNYDDYYYSGNYYNNLDMSGTYGLSGTLRTALTAFIYPKGWYTYGSSGSDHLSTQLQYADEDPTNSSNMIYLYTRDSVKKNAASTWNREHVWPQSLSGPSNNQRNWGTSEAGTDLLHIRPTYNKTNEVRGNDKYGETGKSNPLTYNGMLYGYNSGSYFEPLDSVKGDVARIIMYVWTTYKNRYSTLPAITNVFQSYDVMLKWHMMDRPDTSEGLRNNYSEKSIQKNRNPFVDHPELAWKIFGENCSASVVEQCQAVYPNDGPSPRVVERLEISGEARIQTYYAGDTFNPQGLSVTAYFNDTSSRDVTNSVTWGPNPLAEDTTAVTCTYQGVSASYSNILVLKRPGEGGGSSSNPDEGKGKGAKGCSGSIVGATSIISASALIGLAFIFFEKRK